jgi:hypothetical protein
MSPILLGLTVMLEGAPAAGEQGEPTLAEAAQRSQHGVASAGIDIEVPPACGLFDVDADADADAVVVGVGEGWAARWRRPGRGRQGVEAGGGDAVHRARLRRRDPQRDPSGPAALDVAAVGAGLAGIPQVNGLTPDAGGLLRVLAYLK